MKLMLAADVLQLVMPDCLSPQSKAPSLFLSFGSTFIRFCYPRNFDQFGTISVSLLIDCLVLKASKKANILEIGTGQAPPAQARPCSFEARQPSAVRIWRRSNWAGAAVELGPLTPQNDHCLGGTYDKASENLQYNLDTQASHIESRSHMPNGGQKGKSLILQVEVEMTSRLNPHFMTGSTHSSVI